MERVCLPKIHYNFYYQTWDDNIKMLEGNNWSSWLHPMWVRSGNNEKLPGNVLLQDKANISLKRGGTFCESWNGVGRVNCFRKTRRMVTLTEVAQSRQTDTCLWAVPKVCCIKVHWAEVQLQLLCASWLYIFSALCFSFQQDRCTNFNSGSIQTEQLTDGGYGTVMDKLTEVFLSERECIFPPPF